MTEPFPRGLRDPLPSTATPRIVEAWPELGWVSVDDRYWLARMADGDYLAVHLQPDGFPCRATPRTLDVTSGTKHRVVSEEPMHIEPSILCEVCGFHGFVRDGHWVPA